MKFKYSSYVSSPLESDISSLYNRITEERIPIGPRFREIMLELTTLDISEEIDSPRTEFLVMILLELVRRGIMVPTVFASSELDYLEQIQPLKLVDEGFFHSIPCRLESLPENADLAFFGVPSDLGAAYPGTRFGPDLLRKTSKSFSFRGGTPESIFSIRSGKSPFADIQTFDMGNVRFEDRNLAYLHNRVAEVAEEISSLAVPFMIGGDHSLTLSAFRGVRKSHGNPVTFVQFDSHLDMKLSGEWTSEGWNDLGSPNHANFVSWLKKEFPDTPIVQLGVDNFQSMGSRTFEKSVGYMQDKAVQISDLEMSLLSWERLAPRLPQDTSIYLSIDIDVLSAHAMPNTGYPSRLGISMQMLMRLLEFCIMNNKVVGVDLMEFSPNPHGEKGTEKMVSYLLLTIVEFIRKKKIASH